jgi:hypothetical protein
VISVDEESVEFPAILTARSIDTHPSIRSACQVTASDTGMGIRIGLPNHGVIARRTLI